MKLSAYKQAVLYDQNPASLPQCQLKALDQKPKRNDDRKLRCQPCSPLSVTLFGKRPSQQLNFDVMESNESMSNDSISSLI